VLAEDGAGRSQPEAGHRHGGALAAKKTARAAWCSGPRLDAASGMPRDGTATRRVVQGKQFWVAAHELGVARSSTRMGCTTTVAGPSSRADVELRDSPTPAVRSGGRRWLRQQQPWWLGQLGRHAVEQACSNPASSTAKQHKAAASSSMA
jgi:hypothetical protein